GRHADETISRRSDSLHRIVQRNGAVHSGHDSEFVARLGCSRRERRHGSHPAKDLPPRNSAVAVPICHSMSPPETLVYTAPKCTKNIRLLQLLHECRLTSRTGTLLLPWCARRGYRPSSISIGHYQR